MKGTDNAIMNWAIDTAGAQSLEQHTENKDTYSKLTNREIIGSKAHVQVNALLSGAIDQARAVEIMRDKDFNSVAEDVKQGIRDLAKVGNDKLDFGDGSFSSLIYM